MLLKLKMYKMFGITWEVISDITSYNYSRITKEQRQNKDLVVNDYIQELDEITGKIYEGNENYMYIQAWHKRGGEPINIVTNMNVFVLNDEGKTIERIN